MSILQPYIAALAERTGLPLETTSRDSFTALLDGKALLIQALEKGDAIFFYMEVGRPTLFQRGEVLTELMGGNLFLAETDGAALSYDARNEMVGLNLLLPLHHLESDAFINAVNNFMAAVEHWGEKLAQFNTEAEQRVRQAEERAFDESLDEVDTPSPDPAQMLRV